MFREKYRTYINWGITVMLIFFAGVSFYFLILRWSGLVSTLRTLGSILAPISMGLIFAFILDSLVMTISRLLEKIPHGGRPLSPRRQSVYRAIGIALSEIIFIALIAFLVQSIVPQVIDSLRTLISNFERYVDNLATWAQPYLDDYPSIEPYVQEQFENAEQFINGFLQNDLLRLITSITSGLVEFGAYVYRFVIGLIVSIYLLSSKRRILGLAKKLLFSLTKPARANEILRSGRYTIRVFKGFLVGKLLDSIIIGCLCFLGTMILKIPYALLVSIIVGITNIIPYFGPIIGAIPSALLVLLIDPLKCLVFVIFIIVLQQIDGNIIGPKILGNTTGVSSLGVLLSILIGGGLFGLTGMILCVPTYAVVYSLIKKKGEERLEKKGLPTDTQTYITLDEIDPETLAPKAIDMTAKSSRPGDEPKKKRIFRGKPKG